MAEGPSVTLSFANNFWGKDDAGVGPLLERMHAAKQTSDELKSFYSTRASIEDDYARKLLSLCRKPLGSQETGALRSSLDVMRGEVESMSKQHQSIAAQMKTELEEPLAAFAGAMKERRKIVQNSIEKLHKVKTQQTQHVNKSRDKYEQECLKIKGYLAQGHMVMGQEERKNKAKLEKTQINVATTNTEYENAVKVLEETTARWNREWKAAADKFQDLEEERLDFTKSSLWSFANIASTVCVSDDASCEKIRLSLEKMEVEKDIALFISERGTGQEIPDPPKYINFCRGDLDSQSETSEDDNYSVAQFPRSINPAYRTSSPQPSTYESHHDPNNMAVARDMGAGGGGQPQSDPGSQVSSQISSQVSSNSSGRPSSRDSHSDYSIPAPFSSQEVPSGSASPVKSPGGGSDLAAIGGDPGMMVQADDTKAQKKKSGFFQNHSPFRRKSTKDISAGATAATHRNTWHSSMAQGGPQQQQSQPPPQQQQSGGAGSHRGSVYGGSSSSRFGSSMGVGAMEQPRNLLTDRTASPDPIDANASLALNVGQNVFPVATPARRGAGGSNGQSAPAEAAEEDPIALALAELKGVTVGGKQSAGRMSADHYHGISTPVPGARSSTLGASSGSNGAVAAAMRGTPPPSYDQQVQRLGVPAAAVTSKAMKQTSQKFVDQTRNLFSQPPGGNRHGASASMSSNAYTTPQSRSGGGGMGAGSVSGRSSGRNSYDMPRDTSPRPGTAAARQQYQQSPQQQDYRRSTSPNPQAERQRRQSSYQAQQQQPRGSEQSLYGHQSSNSMPSRAVSPSPYRGDFQPGSSVGSGGGGYGGGSYGSGGRPGSSMGGSHNGDMAVQLAPIGPTSADDGYGSQRGRGSRPGTSSSNSRAMGLYEGAGTLRQRSKSLAENRQYTRDGRPIMHFARALYMYQAAIPEELGFGKGDVLAVLRHQDDGWWEATVHGGSGQVGLVPSNYLQPC
ncbi:cell division control protein [Grosmannia clavigera kw1407]|uniref:Cell division control protein n=1 Tax=Grosmannia clavigera (strain kw1407 / UAMH 11150) TaxID=655863 RepID=F0XT58_GROCL|nr:cell division control protein [Grosmannia clavigera kw1407]EFW99343.1 cell division control protein [Grosmannia clavigera kw1407]